VYYLLILIVDAIILGSLDITVLWDFPTLTLLTVVVELAKSSPWSEIVVLTQCFCRWNSTSLCWSDIRLLVTCRSNPSWTCWSNSSYFSRHTDVILMISGWYLRRSGFSNCMTVDFVLYSRWRREDGGFGHMPRRNLWFLGKIGASPVVLHWFWTRLRSNQDSAFVIRWCQLPLVTHSLPISGLPFSTFTDWKIAVYGELELIKTPRVFHCNPQGNIRCAPTTAITLDFSKPQFLQSLHHSSRFTKYLGLKTDKGCVYTIYWPPTILSVGGTHNWMQ
jgi:hypothetical protein